MTDTSFFSDTPTYYAAFRTFDDDGFVGILADSADGFYVREGEAWHTIGRGNTKFYGVPLFEVSDGAVDLLDSLNSKDVEPSYKQIAKYAVKGEKSE